MYTLEIIFRSATIKEDYISSNERFTYMRIMLAYKFYSIIYDTNKIVTSGRYK